MGASCSDCLKSITGQSRPQYEVIRGNEIEPVAIQKKPSIRESSPAKATKAIEILMPKNSNTLNSDGSNKTPPKNGFFYLYELKEEIGVGSTCTCHRCVRKSDGKSFACKVIDKRQIESKFTGLLDQFYVEIKILQELDHPNIIKLEDVFETADRIFIVMELMEGGELFDYVVEKGTLSEEEASVIVRKLTSAIAHMHEKGVIHRDLKPENLLLTSRGPNPEIKLIDFGLAKIMDEPVAHSFLGTRGYLAPEMLQRHTYDMAIDIWALGTIVFVLLCGCLPFDDDSSRIPSESQARARFVLRFPKWANNLSAPAKDLLQHLLDVNPNTRYKAIDAMKHPWVTGKSVTPGSYLASPGMIGKRRKELREPMTPRMRAMHDRLAEENGHYVPAAPPDKNKNPGISNGPVRKKSF